MTDEDRARIAEIRSRATSTETVWLLDLVDALDRELGLARASVASYREMGAAYEVAAEREEAELRQQLADAEARIVDLERQIGPEQVH